MRHCHYIIVYTSYKRKFIVPYFFQVACTCKVISDYLGCENLLQVGKNYVATISKYKITLPKRLLIRFFTLFGIEVGRIAGNKVFRVDIIISVVPNISRESNLRPSDK